jgi:bacterioferritin (cytochrome b1)
VSAETTTPAARPLTENELWLLSYYRTSEINGALFFGRIARTVRSAALQADITHHFADEANHARYWSECLADLGCEPTRQRQAYQDQYLEAAGVPINLMEVLAVTQVFEKRVIGQYRRHLRFAGTHPRVRETLDRIMRDERWHVKYVREALDGMAARYGRDAVDRALARFSAADQEVYEKTLREYGERVEFLGQTVGEG